MNYYSLFDLEEHKNKLVSTYSTGMKKRLALGKAFLHEPQLLFLDEPTNGLDPDGIKMVLSYLKKFNQETGTTIIICSHVSASIRIIFVILLPLSKIRPLLSKVQLMI